jgi:cytochrome c
MKHHATAWILAASLVAAFGSVQAQPAVDVDAAEKLMKKSGCNKCHALSAKKEGPPYKETAAKYKGKADAEQKLFTHLTTNPKVKVEGKEELHDSPKTKDEAQIRNIVRYVLSR